MLIYHTHTSYFSAAHKIELTHLSLEENQILFGKCANPNWHGHNYTLLVTIKGQINADGYIFPKRALDQLIEEKIIQKIDGSNLNLNTAFMNNLMPSTELIAAQIWQALQQDIQIQNCELHKITLWETKNNFIEYFGT